MRNAQWDSFFVRRKKDHFTHRCCSLTVLFVVLLTLDPSSVKLIQRSTVLRQNLDGRAVEIVLQKFGEKLDASSSVLPPLRPLQRTIKHDNNFPRISTMGVPRL